MFRKKKQVVFHVKNCVKNKKKWWNGTLKISKSPSLANRTTETYGFGPSRVRCGEIRQFWAQKLERVAMDEHVWIHRLSASWRVSFCWFLWVAAAVNENYAVWHTYINDINAVYSIDFCLSYISSIITVYTYHICLYSVGTLSNRELTMTIIDFTSQAMQTDPGWIKNPRAASSVLKRSFIQKLAPVFFLDYVILDWFYCLFIHIMVWVKVTKPYTHKMDGVVLKILKHLKWSVEPPFLPKVCRED